MSYESILIRCDSCNVRIAIQADHVFVQGLEPQRERTIQNGDHHTRLYEGECPKCGEPFEIWQARNAHVTHVTDLQYDRPEVFVGRAKERVDEITREREELEREQAERKRIRNIQKEIQQKEVAERRQRQEEERRLKEERRLERMKALAAEKPKGDDDWDDEDYDIDSGGPSQADMDNHADQMNPNNDAYWSSRG